MSLQNHSAVWPSEIRHGWLARDIVKEQFAHRLTAVENRALRDLAMAARASGIAMETVTAANLPSPELDGKLFALAHDLRGGRGWSSFPASRSLIMTRMACAGCTG